MVHILGGSQTDFERNWKKEGKNLVAMLKEVVNDSFGQTNFSYTELKRLASINKVEAFVGNFIAEKYLDQGHIGSFLTEVNPAFYGVPSARYEAACASGSVALSAAISKILSGEIDVAIVVGIEIMKYVDSRTGGDILGRAAYYEIEGKNVDYPFPKLFGKLVEELLKKYPSLDERRLLDSLAAISCINYANAKRNPNSQTRKWFMNIEQASNRGTETNPFVGGKLAVSDCSQVTDGACCVILCSENYLKEKQLTNHIVVKGFGHRNAPLLFSEKMNDNRNSSFVLPWTRQCVLDAYKMSGLSVDDIDCFETHDCFTSSEYAAISAFGLTEPGKEYEAVESGLISFYGKKPINPSGGLIGCGHPVGATGVRMFLDCFKQVSGKAGSYQLKNVNNALMLNIGGSATTNYSFIIGKEK